MLVRGGAGLVRGDASHCQPLQELCQWSCKNVVMPHINDVTSRMSDVTPHMNDVKPHINDIWLNIIDVS